MENGKNTPWYFEHQRRFKLYKKLESLTGECAKQIVSTNAIVEEWVLHKEGVGKPDLYRLKGNRITGATHVDDCYGKHISITEIDASGLPPIRLNEY
jgi:hypothetical protein